MKLDWNRVKRTAIQSAAGAGIVLLGGIALDMTKETIIAAALQFVITVGTAVLMNIQTQMNDEQECENLKN